MYISLFFSASLYYIAVLLGHNTVILCSIWNYVFSNDFTSNLCSRKRGKSTYAPTYARSVLSTNATPERYCLREPNIAFRIPTAAGCVCLKRMDGWVDGWMDGCFAYAGGFRTHCVNNDRVSCPLSSSWFSRLSPTRVDLGSRKGALCSWENRSDFRERQKAGNDSSGIKRIEILLR